MLYSVVSLSISPEAHLELWTHTLGLCSLEDVSNSKLIICGGWLGCLELVDDGDGERLCRENIEFLYIEI